MKAASQSERPLTMQVVVDGLLVQYRTWGNAKKTILMIHGWGDSSLTFDEIARKFSHQYTLVALDLPGFGGSEMPSDGWAIHDYSECIGHFVKKLEIKPTMIFAHSNGGAIAVHGVAKHHFAADHLVLMASAGVRKRAANPKKIAFRVLSKPPKMLLKILPKAKQDRIKKKIYGVIGKDFYRMEHMRETFKNVVRFDVREDAHKVRTPTLLLYGDKDRSTPASHGSLLASSLSNSKLIILEHAGHFIHHDQVALVEEQILDFTK